MKIEEDQEGGERERASDITRRERGGSERNKGRAFPKGSTLRLPRNKGPAWRNSP